MKRSESSPYETEKQESEAMFYVDIQRGFSSFGRDGTIVNTPTAFNEILESTSNSC